MEQLSVILFVATSLDGYIADKDGNVGWLFSDQDYGYTSFFNSIDALLMGRKTFDQVLTFGPWPYGQKMGYIVTHAPLPEEQEHISRVSGNITNILNIISSAGHRRIWLVGGSEIIGQCVKDNLIDEYIVSIHPIMLGSGFSLSTSGLNTMKLRLKSKKHFASGLVQLQYTKEYVA